MQDNPANPTGLHVYRRLLTYSLIYWPYLLIAIVGLVLSAASQPLFAWIMKPLLDGAIMERDPVVIQWVPLGILGIFLLRGCANFISSYFMGWVGRQVVRTIRHEIVEKLLGLPVARFNQYSSGHLLSHLTYYTDQLTNAATRGITTLIQESLTVIACLGLMFYYSWQLTLGIVVIFPLMTLLVLYVTKRLRRLSHKVQSSMGEITQIGTELIQGYKVVRMFQGERYETERFYQANERNMQLEMKRLTTELASTPIVQFMVALALAGIVFMATRDSLLEDLSPGTFTSFMVAMTFILNPLRNLTQLNAKLQKAIAAGESIFHLLDTPSEKNTGRQRLLRCQGHIAFKEVSFCYEADDRKVLDSVSFEIKPGQRVALVGRSGSGKTTLVNLLMRFYELQEGHIYLDGTELIDIHLQDLRSQIAYVGQDITLFNDTVHNNIAYGDLQDAPTAQVRAAAEAAHALEFIEQMPQGMDTLIGENGVMLSGGQRQRIAIARAILADSPILILDEATSALDSESERYIQAGLERLLQGRTTLMIAHRLSTIESADTILVLRDGVVVESGTHKELMTAQGSYAHLHALQFHQDKDER